MNFNEFVTQLADAYEHLYDLVYLRTHPLTQIFAQGNAGTAKDHAWITHHLLLEVIQELNPGDAPISSREWRRHRLLNLRYADGSTPQAVADQLAISRRHYYRAHDEAVRAIATILWNRFQETDQTTDVTPAAVVGQDKIIVERMELLRLEAAQMSRIDQHSNIQEVLNGVFTLLDKQIQQHELLISQHLEVDLPILAVDPRLLRQLLLALVGYLIERAHGGVIDCQVQAEEAMAQLSVTVAARSRIQIGSEDDSRQRLSSLEELAALCGTPVTPLRPEADIIGFQVSLPILKPQHTVLMIDDNDDTLELVQRYLRFNHFEVITAKTSQQAIETAARIPLSAIILDLMMPDRDGWDLLQFFSHQPLTQSTPIIICSILRQKELALSLGAAAFIEKPFSEQDLVNIVQQLIGDYHPVLSDPTNDTTYKT
jgi:CheY-like chemotaxis protein